MLNYPIKFKPILKEKIWGGTKLRDVLNKQSSLENLGESWEISGVLNAISVVENGALKGYSLTDLLREYKEDFIGREVYDKFGEEFPLLIKFIDAKTELSVQLHPNDELAKKHHNSFGKTEMWYIMQADEGAEINIGFKKNTTKEEYLQKLDNGKIIELLNFEKVKEGDSFFIQTGKVHAIGAGVLLAEIQQTSDITYRIYDWNRRDVQGNTRELHTTQALDAIDFEKKNDYKLKYIKAENKSSIIARCKYFTTNYLSVKGEVEKEYRGLDSFIIYMCVGGQGEIEINGNMEPIEQGQTILIPAINKKVKFFSVEIELLEIYIE